MAGLGVARLSTIPHTSNKPSPSLFCGSREHFDGFTAAGGDIVWFAGNKVDVLGVDGEVNMSVGRVKTFLVASFLVSKTACKKC